ncbi:MAG: Tetratricopeptide TPR 2 repeat protein [Magnetococcales bacterium]|nr:Tetratricopeptide TPR 2 repeat protein [Magnetococcales bacterium]HIJ85793.1 tetratricopeptide repeat protein [Magnetococcales bacterium]
MDKHSGTDPTLTFSTIPATEIESEREEIPPPVYMAASYANAEVVLPRHSGKPDDSALPLEIDDSDPSRPMFMGQTATAQRLLAALDTQAGPISIRGIHFITPQPTCDDAPGEAEKKAGIRLVNQKRYGKAIKHLERAIEYGQDDYICQMNLALAYTRAGRLDEATALLKDLLGSHPADAGIATLLGKSLLLAGRRQEAIDVMAPVAMAHPQRFHLHYYLGIAYAKQDQTLKAVDAWHRAARIRPDDKEIKLWLSIGERMLA